MYYDKANFFSSKISPARPAIAPSAPMPKLIATRKPPAKTNATPRPATAPGLRAQLMPRRRPALYFTQHRPPLRGRDKRRRALMKEDGRFLVERQPNGARCAQRVNTGGLGRHRRPLPEDSPRPSGLGTPAPACLSSALLLLLKSRPPAAVL